MSELLLLKKEDCKSCYKCIRECALKSIRFSENRAQIVERECVYCGHCYVTCPQSAKEIRRDTGQGKGPDRLRSAGDRQSGPLLHC